MNDLALFAPEEKVMTTKELADIWGVDKTTITKTVSRLEKEGEVLHHLTNDEYGNKVYSFDEKQATIIKQEIQKHHNLKNRQIDTVSTEMEENQTIANAMMILQRRSEEYKKRMEIAESALDRIANAKGCFSNSQAAKALQLPYGRNTFISKLREMRIYINSGEPYQDQVSAGHFVVKNKVCSDGTNRPVALVTGKGLVYLSKRFGTRIDESVLPDSE